jgi:hypothetical protein
MITEVAEPIPEGFEANVEIHPAMIEIKLSNIDYQLHIFVPL